MKNKQDALVALSVIVCAGVLLGALVFSISGNPFKKPVLSFTADFESVAGITPHSPVLYAGDKIGVVDNLEQLSPEDRLDPDAIVRLHLSITKDVTVPSNIKISITSDSMLGERYVAIQRINDEDGPLNDGVHLLAGAPPSMLESMIPGGTEIVSDLGAIASNLKSFTEGLDSGDDGKNLSETIANLKDVTGDFKIILRGEGENAEGLKVKLAAITDNMQTLTQDLKELISGPENDPAMGLKTRAGDLFTNLEEFSEELNATLSGTDDEPGLRVKVNTIADEVNAILAGGDGQAGMRDRLDSVMTKLDTVLLEVQAFIVWGEYVTGTLAEKPNRLIFGNKKNEVPTKEQILNYLRENKTPYPVIIEANNPKGDPRNPVPTPPQAPLESSQEINNPPKPKGGFFNNLFKGK
jgi:ABC-type transporter Mla subunit MlaD